MEQTKICTKCGIEKGLGEFHKGEKEKFGVQPCCKLCKSEYSKKYHQKNRERLNEQSKKWRENNREYHNKLSREWNKNNKDLVRKITREWKENNPLKVKAAHQNRRALKRSAQGRITSETYEKLERWNQEYFYGEDLICEYCGCEISGSYHLDHIQPLVKGGSNLIENLAIACSKCNLVKNSKELNEFMPSKLDYFNSRNLFLLLESQEDY